MFVKILIFFVGFFGIIYIGSITVNNISGLLMLFYIIGWVIYDQIGLRRIDTKLSTEEHSYTKQDEIARQIIERYHLKDSDSNTPLTKEIKLENNSTTEKVKVVISNTSEAFDDLFSFVWFILKFLIMTIVVIGSIALEVLWLGFLFGSVLGCILMLIFFPEGFLLPLGLIGLFQIMLYGNK